jgi:hypothetical protein
MQRLGVDHACPSLDCFTQPSCPEQPQLLSSLPQLTAPSLPWWSTSSPTSRPTSRGPQSAMLGFLQLRAPHFDDRYKHSTSTRHVLSNRRTAL